MKRASRSGIAALVLAAAALPLPAARVVSGAWVVKPDTTLEIGLGGADGLRLDNVVFRVPATSGSAYPRTGGLTTLDVAVSNVGDGARRVGLAAALFDAERRLVGAANGGSGLVRLRPGRQKVFRLVLEGAYGEAYRATTLHVALEALP